MLPADFPSVFSPPQTRWFNARLNATVTENRSYRRTRRVKTQRNSLVDTSTDVAIGPSFSLNGVTCPIRPRTASVGRKPPSPLAQPTLPVVFNRPSRVLVYSPGKKPKVDTALERFQGKHPRSPTVQKESAGLDLGVYGCTYGVPAPQPRKSKASPNRRMTDLPTQESPSPLSL